MHKPWEDKQKERILKKDILKDESLITASFPPKRVVGELHTDFVMGILSLEFSKKSIQIRLKTLLACCSLLHQNSA